MEQEKVLVIPTRQAMRYGLLQGLMAGETGRSVAIKILKYMGIWFANRAKAERDEHLLQVIPYVVFTRNQRVFSFVRGKYSTESRLRGNRAIGVGGHINPEDVGGANSCHCGTCIFRRGMIREVREEIGIQPFLVGGAKMVGTIYDSTTAVGRVHVGILMHSITTGEIGPGNHEITDPRWLSVEDIEAGLRNGDGCDKWSQMCLPYLRRAFG